MHATGERAAGACNRKWNPHDAYSRIATYSASGSFQPRPGNDVVDNLTALLPRLRQGLAWRGAFHPDTADGVPSLAGGATADTLALLGFAGRAGWPAFAASPEAADGAPDPLDRWSRRVVTALADELGGTALFPFGGPPWLPFQRWAQRAEPVFASPLGLLIHPQWGLWHSYRGAVAFRDRFVLPAPSAAAHPCDSCDARPCLSACPVGAFTGTGYDVSSCAAHLGSAAGRSCMDEGCAARRACPVGAGHRYDEAASRFYMRAFLAARR
jgi:hypothetical protein